MLKLKASFWEAAGGVSVRLSSKLFLTKAALGQLKQLLRNRSCIRDPSIGWKQSSSALIVHAESRDGATLGEVCC